MDHSLTIEMLVYRRSYAAKHTGTFRAPHEVV